MFVIDRQDGFRLAGVDLPLHQPRDRGEGLGDRGGDQFFRRGPLEDPPHPPDAGIHHRPAVPVVEHPPADCLQCERPELLRRGRTVQFAEQPHGLAVLAEFAGRLPGRAAIVLLGVLPEFEEHFVQGQPVRSPDDSRDRGGAEFVDDPGVLFLTLGRVEFPKQHVATAPVGGPNRDDGLTGLFVKAVDWNRVRTARHVETPGFAEDFRRIPASRPLASNRSRVS